MPRALWPLVKGRPVVQVELQAFDGRLLLRTLLADSGAGTTQSLFSLVLDEEDCLLCGDRPTRMTTLRGAFDGTFPIYLVHVKIAALKVDHHVAAVGVQSLPPGLDGIACFRLLNQFTYGNFGIADQFGLET